MSPFVWLPNDRRKICTHESHPFGSNLLQHIVVNERREKEEGEKTPLTKDLGEQLGFDRRWSRVGGSEWESTWVANSRLM